MYTPLVAMMERGMTVEGNSINKDTELEWSWDLLTSALYSSGRMVRERVVKASS